MGIQQRLDPFKELCGFHIALEMSGEGKQLQAFFHAFLNFYTAHNAEKGHLK